MKRKVIELLLYYCTLLDENSPLKLTYDITKDDPGFDKIWVITASDAKWLG